MSVLSGQILSLAKQLLQGGRAFIVPIQRPGTGEIYTDEDGNYLTDEDGNLLVTEDYAPGFGGLWERFLKAFGGDGAVRLGTLERAYLDANSIPYHILPLANNAVFTDGTVDARDNDCNDLERLYGLVQWGVTSALTPTRLQRMAIIRTRMCYPGTVAPRQSAQYLQSVLNAAGFPVYVYENLTNLSPSDILGIPAGDAIYDEIEYGEADYDEGYSTDDISVIANHIDPLLDNDFDPGPNYYGLIYIAGATISTFATLPAIQEGQFRQLVLNIKAAQMAAFCFINFT